MNAPVRDKLLERETGNLTANRIEPRHYYSIGSIVDDDIHSGSELERANVAALSSDDAALHLIIGKCHGGDCRLRRLFSRNTLDRKRYDLLRFAVGITLRGFTNVTNRLAASPGPRRRT